MQHFKKIFLSCLSVFLGIVFIYSGYTKIYPVIETFEYTFVDIGVANWYTAPVIARLMIGLELILGVLLVMNYNLKRFTIPFTVGLLFFFIIYLCIQIALNGNTGNCGCFGEQIYMSPLKAIIKNVILIIVAIPVYFFHDGWKISKNKLFLLGVSLFVLPLPFIFNAIDYTYSSNNLDEEVNYKLDLDMAYNFNDTTKVRPIKKELRTGKHVIAFFSLTCPHCRIAAKKLKVMYKKNEKLPIYMFLNGDDSNLKGFLDDTHTQNIPYSKLNGPAFIKLGGLTLPKIYYVENGIVIKKVNYFDLDQNEIEEWLSKP